MFLIISLIPFYFCFFSGDKEIESILETLYLKADILCPVVWYVQYVDCKVSMLQCMYIAYIVQYHTKNLGCFYSDYNLLEPCWLYCKICSYACIVTEINLTFLLKYLIKIKGT
jgi:hypothetical protein